MVRHKTFLFKKINVFICGYFLFEFLKIGKRQKDKEILKIFLYIIIKELLINNLILG